MTILIITFLHYDVENAGLVLSFICLWETERGDRREIYGEEKT